MASGGDAFDLWPLEVSQEQAFYSLHPGQKTEVGVKLNLVCFLSLLLSWINVQSSIISRTRFWPSSLDRVRVTIGTLWPLLRNSVLQLWHWIWLHCLLFHFVSKSSCLFVDISHVKKGSRLSNVIYQIIALAAKF